MKDKGSTSNMHKLAKICWSVEIVSKVLQSRDELTIKDVRKSLSEAKIRDGTIMAMFERKGKEVVSSSMKQHTYMETRSVILYILSKKLTYNICRVKCVKWVVESMRSMKIVEDPAFVRLMKTGRPQYRLPSAKTVARNVHLVFRRVRRRIKKMLKVSIFLDLFN